MITIHFLACFGYAGTMNDHNILNLSPFRYNLTNGKFENIDKESNVFPFVIGNDNFHSFYILVDEIYPNLSRFVKCIKQPISQTEMKYTK